ncbi:alpha/beta fold hydrolase [Streptomyces sp. S1D4-11]
MERGRRASAEGRLSCGRRRQSAARSGHRFRLRRLSVLRSIQGPIVLVGHSYGGAVISQAATGNPNVKALVYVSALMPDKGEILAQLAARSRQRAQPRPQEGALPEHGRHHRHGSLCRS